MARKYKCNLFNGRGAVLVEFSIIILPLIWFMIAATDLAMFIVAKQQVSQMANIATFYAANRGIDSTNFSLAVEQSIQNPLTDSASIKIVDTANPANPVSQPAQICGCTATSASPTTTCYKNTDGEDYLCSCSVASGTLVCAPGQDSTQSYLIGQGNYAVITAGANYRVLFPQFWNLFFPSTTLVSGKIRVTTTSYVRIK